MNKHRLHLLVGVSLGLTLAAAGIGGLRAASTGTAPVAPAAQSDTQHGFTVTLEKITSGPDGTRLQVGLANRGSETVYFYESNTEIWLDGKKYEPERVWGPPPALPDKFPAGSHAKGIILFPPLAPGDSDVLVRFQRPANADNSARWNPVEFHWPRPFPVAATASAVAAGPQRPASPRIAIIRADDMTGRSPGWDRFLSSSRKLGIKVAIGIICDSLQSDHDGYYTWLRDLQQSGEGDTLIHGWDHQKLPSDGLHTVSEFRDSGYDYQRKHLADSQALMLKVLGRPAVALGTPWNDFDRDTIRVVSQDPDVRLFFAHQTGLFDGHTAVMRILAIPNDGTGKPNFEKFKAFYDAHQDRFGAVAFQFHPAGYSAHRQAEYERIITCLRDEGWIFMQPREYLAWRKAHASP